MLKLRLSMPPFFGDFGQNANVNDVQETLYDIPHPRTGKVAHFTLAEVLAQDVVETPCDTYKMNDPFARSWTEF